MVSTEPMNPSGAELPPPRAGAPSCAPRPGPMGRRFLLRQDSSQADSLLSSASRDGHGAKPVLGRRPVRTRRCGRVPRIPTPKYRDRFQQVFAEPARGDGLCLALRRSRHSVRPQPHLGDRPPNFRSLLPSAREHADASKLLVTLYPNKTHRTALPRASRRNCSNAPITILTPPDDPKFASHEYLDLQQAMRLLSSRVAAHRTQPRSPGTQLRHSTSPNLRSTRSLLPPRRSSPLPTLTPVAAPWPVGTASFSAAEPRWSRSTSTWRTPASAWS